MADLKIKRLGLIAKPQNPLAAKAVIKVKKWGKKNAIEILADESTAKLIDETGIDSQSLADSVDALIVLGGDGTFLAAARLATKNSTPLLGVNLGSLGFMTETAFEEMEHVLNRLIEENYKVEERMMLDVVTEKTGDKPIGTALNDVVLSHKSQARIIELSVTVNGDHLTHYKSDGLIVSTPTGSTAYALSAGGPIIYPELEAIIICPICPHTLSNRPLVIPGSAVIKVSVLKEQEEVIATLDGQIWFDVNEHNSLTLRRSEKVTRLIKVPDRTYFDVLRSKLGWGGSSGNHG